MSLPTSEDFDFIAMTASPKTETYKLIERIIIGQFQLTYYAMEVFIELFTPVLERQIREQTDLFNKGENLTNLLSALKVQKNGLLTHQNYAKGAWDKFRKALNKLIKVKMAQ